MSNSKLRVEVKGIDPDPSPGNLPPSPDADGSSAGSHFGDIVRIEDKISVVWTANGKINQQVFLREDLGIPRSMSGGSITFTFLPAGSWKQSIQSEFILSNKRVEQTGIKPVEISEQSARSAHDLGTPYLILDSIRDLGDLGTPYLILDSIGYICD